MTDRQRPETCPELAQASAPKACTHTFTLGGPFAHALGPDERGGRAGARHVLAHWPRPGLAQRGAGQIVPLRAGGRSDVLRCTCVYRAGSRLTSAPIYHAHLPNTTSPERLWVGGLHTQRRHQAAPELRRPKAHLLQVSTAALVRTTSFVHSWWPLASCCICSMRRQLTGLMPFAHMADAAAANQRARDLDGTLLGAGAGATLLGRFDGPHYATLQDQGPSAIPGPCQWSADFGGYVCRWGSGLGTSTSVLLLAGGALTICLVALCAKTSAMCCAASRGGNPSCLVHLHFHAQARRHVH